MTQKILAAHAGLDSVKAGQLIMAKLDVVMANDITGPMALPIFRQMADQVYDKDKVVLVPDHFTPNKDIKSAENSKAIREFAKAQGLTWYFEQGKSVWSMRSSRRQALWQRENVSSAQTPIHVHTGRWGHFPPESGRRTLRPGWRPENFGSKFRAQSSLC